MWDTAGQERFRTITYQFYKQAHGIVIVFDITNMETFQAVRAWLASIYKYSDQQVAKVLVGNKTDLNEVRVVEESKARQLARENGMEYFETSALNNSNIQETMKHIMQKSWEIYFKNAPEEEESQPI